MPMNELIKTNPELKAEDIRDIFSGHLLALRIPSYFSSEIGKEASRKLTQQHGVNRWHIGLENQVLTDMNYLLGIPRQVAQKSPEGIEAYHKSQESFLVNLRRAFPGGGNPLEKFLSELNDQFEGQMKISEFEGRPGLPAVARFMSPETMLAPDQDGICHIDSSPDRKMLSANLYLELPETGGELEMWNWPLSQEDSQGALYRMVTHHAFDENFRGKIKPFLPTVIEVPVKEGDLIIFDTSKVHAVKGFQNGRRLTLQTFLLMSEESSLIVRS